MSQLNHGLILFAHGSRDPAWSRPLLHVCDCVREADDMLYVMPAFLEFIEPSLPEAIDQLVSKGVQRVTIVPCFLSPAGHVRRDVPALIEAIRLKHPHLDIQEVAPIGESDIVVNAIAKYALQCLNAGPFHPNPPQ